MIKENINKIDFDLKNLFDNVIITEKSTKSNFIVEINASSVIDYDGIDKKAEVIVEIAKPDLNSNTIKWSYSVNPNRLDSDKIEIVSDIDTIANDIFKIVSKKRMSSDYFESLQPFFSGELINENVEEELGRTKINPKLDEILDRFNIYEELVNESKYVDGVTETLLVYRKAMKPADRYMLDFNFKSIGVDNVSYEDDNIIIKL